MRDIIFIARNIYETIVNSRGEFGMSVLNFLTRPGEIAETNYGRVAGCRMHFML